MQRNINPHTSATHFDRGRHQRLGAPQQFAHAVATRHMPERTMLQLSVDADNRCLAVAFNG